MPPTESSQLDPERLHSWHVQYATRLRAFTLGLLKNSAWAEEAVQATFAKALQSGGDVATGSEKSWLFQVAFHEALELRRRRQRDERKLKSLQQHRSTEDQAVAADFLCLRDELVTHVREALSRLPEPLQDVVRLRIYEERTFQEIAEKLKIPLGTALTRMRSALRDLQTILKDVNEK